MLVLAAGLYFGSRIPPQVAGRANMLFVQAWIAITGLIIVMLGLALLDWIATRMYARRQRRILASERRRILRETLVKRPENLGSESEQLPQ